MRALIVVIFLTLIFFRSYSQGKYLTGIVIDDVTSNPIRNANILIYSDKKKTGHFVSDSLGKFKIPINLLLVSNLLEVSMRDYHTFSSKLELTSVSIKNESGEFRLKPEGINLNEVVIKKKHRYRDTTEIKLSDKKFERNIMIDDLFSKELGFYKDNSGLLYYKGKLVSDIVVNGRDFFGKNNRDIYKNLPALILNSVEIVETDIDSLTNTTQLRPTIKVNLKFKDKYKKGKFGNLNLGGGTSKRYIGGLNLYTFRQDEQISLMQNSNNINVNDSFSEPKINFSGSTNNKVVNNSKITYRNLLFKNKIELNANLNLNLNTINFDSETNRKDENLNQFSIISTNSNSKNTELNGTGLVINYKINPLNALKFEEYLNYSNLKQSDDLDYHIRTDNILANRSLSKIRAMKTRSVLTSLMYQKRFFSKPGRVLNSSYIAENNKYEVGEDNRLSGDFDDANKDTFINGKRIILENKKTVNFDFTEPIEETAFFTFSVKFKDEKADQSIGVVSDSTNSNKSYKNNLILRDYFVQGVRIYKNLGRITIDASTFNNVSIVNINSKDLKYDYWNFDGKIDLDYKLSKNKRLSGHFIRTINYPSINLLTANNRSFDLLSRESENLKLKPELKNVFEFSYDLIKTDSLNFAFDGKIEHYKYKFGFNIDVTPDKTQIMYNDNVGEATNAHIGAIFSKDFSNGYNFNYDLKVAYTETPSVLNRQNQLNKNIGLQQSISLRKTVLWKKLSISPSVFSSLSRYKYQNDSGNQLNIVYTDNISLSIFRFELNLYPIVNYSYIVQQNSMFALNAEIKRNFLKKYGSIWLKAYDVFNSFSYVNNINTSTYVQSMSYSNLSRYFLLGLSIKFNNMK